MRRRLRQRLIQTVVLGIVVAVGIWAYRGAVGPRRTILTKLAKEKLEQIFAPATVDFAPATSRIDLVRGVTLRDLTVALEEDGEREVVLEADRVFLEHDLIELASGRYVPQRIRIEGPRIQARETEDGLDLAVPVSLESADVGGPIPVIEVRRGHVEVRAMAGTQRFAHGDVVIELVDVELDVTPARNDEVRIRGGFRTLGLGQDETRIDIHGPGWPKDDRVEVGVEWKGLRVNEDLLGILSDELRRRLERPPEPDEDPAFDEGRLLVKQGDLLVVLMRDAAVDSGRVRAEVRWKGELPEKLASIPGAENIEIVSLEQLNALFATTDLEVEIREGSIDVSSVVALLGGGEIKGQATLDSEGMIQQLTVSIDRARIDGEEIRKALGEAGRRIADAFNPSGEVTALFTLTTQADGTLDWSIDALLEDAELSYAGMLNEEGERAGFPYSMEAASGQIAVTPGRVELSEIQGTHGAAQVRILGHRDNAGNVVQLWTGEGETGRILMTEDGPDIALTVEARQIPVDDDLREAVDRSEFAGLLEEYQVEGTIDRLAVDIVSKAGVDDKAVAEVRLDFEDERFRYRDFPLQMEAVTGWVELRRPLLPDDTRGRSIAFEAGGTVDGAPVRVTARILEHESRGRLRVTANDFPLVGQLADTIAEAEATKGGLDAVWRYLAPTGRADVEADLPLSDDPDPLRMAIALKDATIHLDAEDAPNPLIVEHLHGEIEVVDDQVTLNGLRGMFQGTPVLLSGFVDGGTDGEWDLEVQTSDALTLTPQLLEALPYYLGESSFLPQGLSLESGGSLVLSLRLYRAPGEDEALTAEVSATSIKARIRLPEGTAVDVEGQGLEVIGSDVRIHGLRATANGLEVDVGRIAVGEDGLRGDLRLGLDEFVATEDLLTLVPASARDLVADLLENRLITTPGLDVTTREDGSVQIEGELTILPPEGEEPGDSPRGTIHAAPIEIDPGEEDEDSTVRGRVRFVAFSLGSVAPLTEIDGVVDLVRLTLGDEVDGDFTIRLDRARLFDVRVEDVTLPFRWDAGILRVDTIAGRLAGGALRGRFMAHTRAPAAFEGEASLAGFDVALLAEDLADAGSDFAGRGRASVSFQNRSGEADDLVAVGEVRVEDGDLGDLPGVTNIFTLFDSLRKAEHPPKFERGHAKFTLRGQVIRFEHLDLSGPLFDLPGQGTIDLDGTADLVFTPHLLKGFLLPGVMQFPGVGKALGTVLPESLLYVVRLRGDIADAEPEVQAFPRTRRPGGSRSTVPKPPRRHRAASRGGSTRAERSERSERRPPRRPSRLENSR